MCLIIHNPKAKSIPLDIIDSALWQNPDGFGIFFHDNGEIVKTMGCSEAEDLLASGRPFTAHFRYATSGPIGKQQCHPFNIDKRYALMMNGTIDRLVSRKTVDTEALCKILHGLSEDKMLAILATYPCRFALLDRKSGKAIVVNRDLWVERSGVLYSKGNCFNDGPPKAGKASWMSTNYDWQGYPIDGEDPDPPYVTTTKWKSKAKSKAKPKAQSKPEELHTVAVYGTLKSGFHNHELLSKSYALGEGQTAELYPMVVSGIPYLIDDAGIGNHVRVEVYRVTSGTLAQLDSLEGHPNWYVRKQKLVQLDKGGTIKAWIYTIPRDKQGTHACFGDHVAEY
jgi:gamma-glutamylaminecyclotransferase